MTYSKFGAVILAFIIGVSVFGFGYNVGYDAGRDEGFKAGYEDGRSAGYGDGYEAGYVEGCRIGREEGFSSGYREGNKTSFDTGYRVGFKEGKEAGYEEGFKAGWRNGNETGYNLGYESGYLKGVEDGAGRGFTVRDPTYKEALDFILRDQTDKHEYNEENYTCLNFAADFKNNAFKAGYRCGFVYIEFPEEHAHAIVCFNTTDRGLIFIEPQDDSIVELKVGRHYWSRTKIVMYNDTVINYVIIW